MLTKPPEDPSWDFPQLEVVSVFNDILIDCVDVLFPQA
jgi:hypothetical protein